MSAFQEKVTKAYQKAKKKKKIFLKRQACIRLDMAVMLELSEQEFKKQLW